MAEIDIRYQRVKSAGRALAETSDGLTGPVQALRTFGADAGSPGFRMDTALASICAEGADIVTTAQASLDDLGSRLHKSGSAVEQVENLNAQLGQRSVPMRPDGRA